MIDQLFDWGGNWSQLDTWRFCFRDVTLKVPIGTFPAGSKPLQITVDFRRGTLEITNDVIHSEVFEMKILLEAKQEAVK